MVRFQQVDVFTDTPFLGNPVAVVLDAAGLSTEEMQRIAHWTNLSETTFLLPPRSEEADYRVRIFTPSVELPFAGHPTLGSCHAWLSEGGEPATPDHIVQECGVGLVTIGRRQGLLSFAAPPLIRSGPPEEDLVQEIATVLGVDRTEIKDAQWVDNGPGWVAVLLESAAAVLGVQPGPTSLDLGVVGFYPPGSTPALEVRAFFPKDGISTAEDPVTGSLNASLAQWLISSGRIAAPYVASQGAALGREGRVMVSQDEDGTIWVGGGTVSCVSGTIETAKGRF